MEIQLLCLVVTLFSVNAGEADPPPTPPTKPGCLPVDPNMACIRFDDVCKSKDKNCKKGQICCPTECGTRCEKPSPCTLPKDPGPCKRKITRWYYDAKTDKCRKFTYGGCQGNANNFKRRRQCRRATKRCVCFLPKDPGPCQRPKRRFYYRKAMKKCEEFQYGGCKGNKNNFKTEGACKRKCVI